MENHHRLLIICHKLIVSLHRNAYSKVHVALFCSELQILSSLYTDHLCFIRHLKIFVKKNRINVYCVYPFYGMSFLKSGTIFVYVSFVADDQT